MSQAKHVKIPINWAAPDALAFVGFLERIIEAVWRAHGYSMAEYLRVTNRPIAHRNYSRGQRACAQLPKPAPAVVDEDDIPW